MTSDVPETVERVSRAGECIDGRYQLETEIGAGGLGSVYRATQTKLARQVAVKLLHEHMGTSDVQRARFEREARSLAALEHPNIVSILDYGVAADQPYIVTELLEGETLAQRLRAGSLPLDEGLALAHELLDALAFMHEAGVVHRDLKASNVFLQRVHDGERVKLLDFGLAKTTVSPGVSGDSTLTRDGTVVGTPAYMSPEQATGDVVDARSDVYAVGVLLYQMLTGRLPFEGDAIDQVRSHLVEPVPALELERSSSPLVPPARLRRLDAALEALIRRAMAKRREDRFPDARAMLLALCQVRERGEQPTLQPPAATMPRLTARQMLSPLPAALRVLQTLCVLAVAAQVVLLLWLLRDDEGAAALRKLGERSRVALSQLGEQSSAALRRFSDHDGGRSRLAPGTEAPGNGSRAAESGKPNDPSRAAHSGTPDDLSRAARSGTPEDPSRAAGSGEADGLLLPPGAPPTAAAGSGPLVTPGSADPPLGAADLGVPGPPKARNPWAKPVPAELRGYRKAIVAGGAGDDRVALALKNYSQSHPGDPRAQLLLGQMYLNRNWRSDAVAHFASALKADLSARGAPEVLPALLELVASGKSDSEASALIVRAYGSEALPAVASLANNAGKLAKLSSTRAPDASARLRALRTRLDRAAGPAE